MDQFKDWVDRSYLKNNETMRLPFRDEDDAPDEAHAKG